MDDRRLIAAAIAEFIAAYNQAESLRDEPKRLLSQEVTTDLARRKVD